MSNWTGRDLCIRTVLEYCYGETEDLQSGMRYILEDHPDVEIYAYFLHEFLSAKVTSDDYLNECQNLSHRLQDDISFNDLTNDEQSLFIEMFGEEEKENDYLCDLPSESSSIDFPHELEDHKLYEYISELLESFLRGE